MAGNLKQGLREKQFFFYYYFIFLGMQSKAVLPPDKKYIIRSYDSKNEWFAKKVLLRKDEKLENNFI